MKNEDWEWEAKVNETVSFNINIITANSSGNESVSAQEF